MRLFLVGFLILVHQLLIGQCPQGDYLINIQDDIDSYLDLYPNCTEIEGSLIIEPGADFLSFDFSPIAHLKIIGGSLIMRSNFSSIVVSNPLNLNLIREDIEFSGIGQQQFINSVQVLRKDILYKDSDGERLSDLETFISNSNITQIGGNLSISNCPKVRDLSFFNSVQEIGESIILENLDSLTSLNGFDNITSIDGGLIIKNTGINTCSGLDQVKSIRRICTIQDNPNLQSLNGLNQLESVGLNFNLINNPIVNLIGLDRLSQVGNSFIISELSELRSLEGLISMKEIKTLSLSRLPISNLQGTQSIEGIETLSIADLPNLEIFEGFNSLRELDDFLIDNCSTLTSIRDFGIGPMHIENITFSFNPELVDLSSSTINLRHLGSLRVYDNPKLESLDYITVPDSLALLSLIANESLEEVNFLGNVKYIRFNLELIQLFSLKNQDFVSSITNVRNDVILEDFDSLPGLKNLRSCRLLNINSNDNLGNLDDFYYLKEVESLRIWGNDNLSDITGICDLQISNKLDIIRNPKLNYCNCKNICNFVNEFPSQTMIRNNGFDCDNIDDFEANCAETGLLIQVYHDTNRNNIYDPNEEGVNLGKIQLENGFTTFPIDSGRTYLELEENTLYSLYYTPPYNWVISQPSSKIEILSSQGIEYLSIGIHPDTNQDSVSASVISEGLICNQTAQFQIEVSNYGSSNYNGRLIFRHEGENIEGKDVYDANSVLIEIDELPPGASFLYTISIKSPSSERENELLKYHLIDISNDELLYEYMDQLKCLPIESDKLGIPYGEGDEKRILPNDNIRYLIRFQNNRACPARHIVVEDKIDNSVLDLTTLRDFSSSHPISAVELDGNMLKFRFENICLPDSTFNINERSAYVAFTINQVDDLTNGTYVDNSAKVYYDFIDTSQTEIESKLIHSEVIVNQNEIEIKSEINIYPNPANDHVFIDDQSKGFNFFEVTNLIGNSISKGPIYDQRIALDIPSGLYILNVYSSNKKASTKLIVNR